VIGIECNVVLILIFTNSEAVPSFIYHIADLFFGGCGEKIMYYSLRQNRQLYTKVSRGQVSGREKREIFSV
jgi:hypothetical protein